MTRFVAQSAGLAQAWDTAPLLAGCLPMTDRFFSLMFLCTALGLAGGAVLLFIVGFIEYLQAGRWPSLSLLQLGYETHLIKARWFLANQWSWPVHDALDRVPVTLAMLCLAPLCWWLGGIFGRR